MEGKIIQISQTMSEEGYELMCLTDAGKVYERITEQQWTDADDDQTSGIMSPRKCVYRQYWKEVPEERIDKGFKKE